MKLFNSTSLLLLSLGALTLTNCKKEDPIPVPSSCFTADNLTPLAEDTVAFTSCSENSDLYYWDFGDSTYSAEKNPTHAYIKSGVYEVTQTVYNFSGKKSSTQEIEVIEKTPLAMVINKLVISRWPDKSSLNQPWDADGGPDLFYDLYENNVMLFLATEYKIDCVNGTPYSFELDFPFISSKMSSVYKINVYDFDAVGLSQNMGSMSFTPITAHEDTNPIIYLSNINWEMELHVDWVY